MPKQAALLRAINLGSHNRIKMPELKALVEELGFGDVETYLQSGNAVFDAGETSPDVSAKQIEQAIGRELELDVPTIVRTAAELQQIIAASPYTSRESDPKKLHVMFLDAAPATQLVDEIDRGAYTPDEFHVIDRDIHLLLPSGAGRTKLNGAFFERKLKVTGTARNWNTVTQLLALASETE